MNTNPHINLDHTTEICPRENVIVINRLNHH